MTDKPAPPQSPGLDEARIADIIGWYMASVISGNNQPDMSGDPRKRITGNRRRHFDDACQAAAQAIRVLPAQSPVLPPSGVLEKIDNLLDAVWNADERKDEVQALVAVKNYVRAALSASVAGEAERLWCKACGTVTRDRLCDCNRWPEGHEMKREPNFVNYADSLNDQCRELILENERLRAPSPALDPGTVEACAKVADNWIVIGRGPEIAKAIRALASSAPETKSEET